MFKALLARARQGYRTADYPAHDPVLPALFRGRPVLDPGKCVDGCARCVEICPTDALRVSAAGPELDLGRCIFCGECAAALPRRCDRFHAGLAACGIGARRGGRDGQPGKSASLRRAGNCGDCWGGRCGCARSVPGAATAARPRSMRSAMSFSTRAASGSISSPRRAMPTAFSSPDPSPRT